MFTSGYQLGCDYSARDFQVLKTITPFKFPIEGDSLGRTRQFSGYSRTRVSPLLGMGSLKHMVTGYGILVTRGMEHRLRVRLHSRWNAFGHVYDDI